MRELNESDNEILIHTRWSMILLLSSLLIAMIISFVSITIKYPSLYSISNAEFYILTLPLLLTLVYYAVVYPILIFFSSSKFPNTFTYDTELIRFKSSLTSFGYERIELKNLIEVTKNGSFMTLITNKRNYKLNVHNYDSDKLENAILFLNSHQTKDSDY